MLRIAAMVFGFLAFLLGGLWLLQGLGLGQVGPILCFADCAPVQGPSLTWAVIGASTVALGGFGVAFARKSRDTSTERIQRGPGK